MRRRDLFALGGVTLAPAGCAGTGGVGRPGPSLPRAEERRAELYRLLGDLPDRQRPTSASKRAEEERDGYVLETWELDLNGFEPVPAYLARPRGLAARAPAVLFNHSHGGGYTIGK